MARTFSVRTDNTNVMREEYRKELEAMDFRALVKEFISYLDYTEWSDNDREFHPITIGSVRCLMSEPLGMCLEKIRGELK